MCVNQVCSFPRHSDVFPLKSPIWNETPTCLALSDVIAFLQSIVEERCTKISSQERHDVSNYQWRFDCMTISAWLTLSEVIHRSTVDSLHKGPVTRALIFPLMLVKQGFEKKTVDLPEIWAAMALFVVSL